MRISWEGVEVQALDEAWAAQIRRAQERECPELIMKAAAVVNEVGATQSLELCSQCGLAHASTMNIKEYREYHVLTIGASDTHCSARDSSWANLPKT